MATKSTKKKRAPKMSEMEQFFAERGHPAKLVSSMVAAVDARSDMQQALDRITALEDLVERLREVLVGGFKQTDANFEAIRDGFNSHTHGIVLR